MIWALKRFFRFIIYLPLFLVSPIEATRKVFKRKHYKATRNWIDIYEEYSASI